MGLWRDKKRGDWRYSFEAVKKVYAGGGFKTKAEARAAREDRRKKVKAEAGKQTVTDTGFLRLVNLYLDWSERRHAAGNVNNKKVVFRKFVAFLEISEDSDYDILSLSPARLAGFLATSPSQNSYNNYRKELSALFSWVQKIHVPQFANPCLQIEKMPSTTLEKQIPTKTEFLQLLAAAGPDDKPLLVILVHTLARIDEILRLKWQDVNFERQDLTLWTRKNRGGEWKSRIIPMNADLKAMLWSLWQRRKQDQWVFFNSREGTRYLRRPKFMRRVCARAGIPHYGFHAIRHWSATYLHDVAKVPTGVLSVLLGHANRRTTEIYLHSVEGAAREALMRLEGVFDGISTEDISPSGKHRI